MARGLLLSSSIMKMFLVLVLSVTALFLWQRGGEKAATADKSGIEAPTAAIPPVRPVSEHNWAKHSLDRAHEVADQVRQTREENEQR